MRLVTFNILGGRSPGEDRVDVARFAAAVRALQPDVLALQEVDRGQDRTQHADLTAVAASAMDAVDHRFVAALTGTPGATWTAATGDEHPDSAAYGIALLSRRQVRAWEVVRLPALPGRAPWVWHGRKVPSLVRDEPRVAVGAELDGPTGPVTLATTHLSFLPGWNVVQLRRAVRALRSTAGPLVLMGDLNMSPGTARRVSGLVPVVAGPTFPVAHPARQIDHVLLDPLEEPRWRGVAGRTVPTGLSDHLALVVDLPVC
ncbi:MAG TPA: endonuclease/exonuclease/phosphatase family protein [Actinomycetes bacterium]|nr:endonuclease/exonuclease/phosphatase family protein [Actinomycetes bacterium]